MDLLFLFGILIVFFGTAAAIPYYLWRRGGAWRISSAAIIGLIVYEAFTAIWPPDSFYLDEFEYRSGKTLPTTASILDKDSTYPDFHGDYYSEAVIRLNTEDFEALKSQLSQNGSSECFTPDLATHYLTKSTVPLACWTFNKDIDDQFFIVLFSDGKTIYFHFSQT